MFNIIRYWLSERAGRAQALQEIRFLDSGYIKGTDLAVLVNPRLRYDGPSGRNTSYIRGYAFEWSRAGLRDAKEGRIRSEKFGNVDYERGWIEGMRHIREKGYRHHRLDQEYERLIHKHYPQDLWILFGVIEGK